MAQLLQFNRRLLLGFDNARVGEKCVCALFHWQRCFASRRVASCMACVAFFFSFCLTIDLHVGTLCAKLAEDKGFKHFSAGDLLRAEAANPDSARGN